MPLISLEEETKKGKVVRVSGESNNVVLRNAITADGVREEPGQATGQDSLQGHATSRDPRPA